NGKREAATQAALAKGLITPEQASANSKNIFFTIEDEDDNDSREYTDSSRTMMHDSSSAESSTKSREATPHDDDSQISSLNKPRNPSERLFVQDVDYDDVTDYDD
ncbi:22665_t:CDS:1, partial [Racocetra persica]